MSHVSTREGRSQERLLRAIYHLLALDVTDVERALNAAAQQIAEVMEAEKVDVFLPKPGTGTLLAVGTNDSPMARKQKQLGLDRLPASDGSVSAYVFQTGQSRLSAHLDRDPLEHSGIVHELGVRSQIAVPVDVRGTRRGVLILRAATPGRGMKKGLASASPF